MGKKIAIIFYICLVSVVIVGAIIYSNGTSTSTDEYNYTEVAQTPNVVKTTSYSETKTEEKRASNPIEERLGKYTFTDALGNKYTLTLKSDKTATIESHYRGFSTTYYGSWDHFSFMSAFSISFPYEDSPYMNFTTNPSERERGSGICLSDNEDFLYKNSDAAKAKNPNLRFEVKKME